MSTPNLIDSALSQQATALPPATPNTSESSNLINKSMGLDSAPAAPAAPQAAIGSPGEFFEFDRRQLEDLQRASHVGSHAS
jgi:hypothetical protein